MVARNVRIRCWRVEDGKKVETIMDAGSIVLDIGASRDRDESWGRVVCERLSVSGNTFAVSS